MFTRMFQRALVPVVALTLVFSGAMTASAAHHEGDALTKAIAQLNADQKAALLVLVKGIVDAKAPQSSPTEGALETVAAYVKATESGDIDAAMACFSENFDHYELGDKEGLRQFFEGAESEGMLEDISGNTEDAEAELDGDTVTVYPVELEGLFGTVTFEFELKAENGAWKIVSLDMTGV